MSEISHADLQALFQDLQGTVRHECGLIRNDVAELKREQVDQAKAVAQNTAEIARLDERTKHWGAGALSRKQKAAVATAAVPIIGAVLDGLRHLVLFVLATWKGQP